MLWKCELGNHIVQLCSVSCHWSLPGTGNIAAAHTPRFAAANLVFISSRRCKNEPLGDRPTYTSMECNTGRLSITITLFSSPDSLACKARSRGFSCMVERRNWFHDISLWSGYEVLWNHKHAHIPASYPHSNVSVGWPCRAYGYFFLASYFMLDCRV